MRILKYYKTVLLYSVSLAILFLSLQLMEYKLIIIDHSVQIYGGSIALLFLLLGIWLSRKLFSPKKEIQIVEKKTIVEKERIVEREKIIEKEVFVTQVHPFIRNENAVKERDISVRELEVLELIAKGASNKEIAAALFVSVNTVKTHLANLYFKLDVSRRTQAVEKARQLHLIP